MTLTVVTWLWGTKYPVDYVRRLAAGVRRNLKQPHRFVCVTDRREEVSRETTTDIAVWSISDPYLVGRGCFCRVRMFDPHWQIGVEDRIVCLDLDLVITGPLDELFDRPESFVIWQGANQSNPCPYNGSVMMLRKGAHPEVWRDLTPANIEFIPRHEFPDDQGWLWHKIPNAAGWPVGQDSGIWAFGKQGWPKDNHLPKDARIVAFPGKRDPDQFKSLGWVRHHWLDETAPALLR